MKLRPYQNEAIKAVESAFLTRKSALIVLATGLGKTEIFLELARNHQGTAIVLADKDNLIKQTYGRMKGRGVKCSIFQGSRKINFAEIDCDSPVIISSIQTISRPKRWKQLLASLHLAQCPKISLVVIDEAHHAASNSWRRAIREIQEQNPEVRVLGVTATPKRSDGKALSSVFERCDTGDGAAYSKGIADAIAEGWLVPVVPSLVRIDGLDFSGVRAKGSKLDEKQLEAILTEEKHLHAVARPTIEQTRGRSTLVFCVTIAHAEAMAYVIQRYLNEFGIPEKAAAVSGVTDEHEQERIIEDFKAGQINYLCSCSLITEGFDAPNTSAVVMARPMKSISLFEQCLGRGVRPIAGLVDLFDTAEKRRKAIAGSGKPNCLLLDFIGNAGKHRLANVYDVLGGKLPGEIREAAFNSALDERSTADVLEALERAKVELELLEEIKALKPGRDHREKIIAAVRYSVDAVDIFGGETKEIENAPKPIVYATPEQVKHLSRLAIRAGDRIPNSLFQRLKRGEAGALINAYNSGKNYGRWKRERTAWIEGKRNSS